MEKEHRLKYIIGAGFQDIFWIWNKELKRVFRDSGVMIFFFLVPFVYPVLYSLIYNPEVMRNARLVVVDQCDSYLSREFTRRMNATADVEVIKVCTDMVEAKHMMDSKKAYGILYFPSDFSKTVHKGEQANVSLYCDMSGLLFYKAFLISATEVSFDLGKELQLHTLSSSRAMDEITVTPIPYKDTPLFNTANGFASFLVPAILILVIQQTLILGIGMLGGTARERNRFHCLVPASRHHHGSLRIVLGKSLAYLMLYAIVSIWIFVIVPSLFSFPQIGHPMTLLQFIFPFLLACIFMSMTLSGFLRSRESPMLIFVFTSVILLFISGVSWPWTAIPPFWKALAYFFPSTMGIQGYIQINSCGATLPDVAHAYRVLWCQAGIYFITTCIIYRYQIIKCQKQAAKHAMKLRRYVIDQTK